MERPVFRFASSVGDEATLAAEARELAKGGDAFFYAKLPTTDVAACLALGSAGFDIVDTGITFAWSAPGKPASNGVAVDLVSPAQHEAVATVAETSFRWSRFHLDPRIPPALANLIKRRWIENYLCGKRGSALYAAQVGGSVAGFLAVIEANEKSGPVAVIDLIAVAPEHQHHGVGGALIERFVSDWRERSSELRVGTQAANIRSLRFYETNGFRIVGSNYVLHAHYRKGEIQR